MTLSLPTIAIDLPTGSGVAVEAALMMVCEVFGPRASLLDRGRLLIVRLDGDEVRRRAYYRLCDELTVQQLRSEMASWRGGLAERKAG